MNLSFMSPSGLAPRSVLFTISHSLASAWMVLVMATIVPSVGRAIQYDLVIYGATSAGVAAAVQARRHRLDVLLICPGNHLGGLTTGGLGATDIGNKQAIGGVSREFYRRLGDHYSQRDAWVFESRDDYKSYRQVDGETEMWTFEPHVAKETFLAMLREADVRPVVMNERIDRTVGCQLKDGRIAVIRMESGHEFAARYFLDCTYEGDLLAAAGVAYHVGREANEQYGETLNGVQHAKAIYHQFDRPVDPYQVRGNRSSGLLFGIQNDSPGVDGEGDHRLQAYCYRMCLTDAPKNQIAWQRPDGYDPGRYELLARYFAAGFEKVPWHITMMPNRKTDINNNHGFSTDFIGANYNYPEAGYAEREEIVRRHREYQLGLMWFLASDERVPVAVREEVNRWGVCQDEFTETGGWPPQLYIREARRMVGMVVMTEHHCVGKKVAKQSVGMAAYTMDSHNTQRFARDGRAWNEGDVQVGGFPPFPIEYGAICPRQADCENLLVPVCLSASHIAYGSIRMEPVFMVLGHSAATAVWRAIEEDECPVQQVDYARLRAELLRAGQQLGS